MKKAITINSQLVIAETTWSPEVEKKVMIQFPSWIDVFKIWIVVAYSHVPQMLAHNAAGKKLSGYIT